MTVYRLACLRRGSGCGASLPVLIAFLMPMLKTVGSIDGDHDVGSLDHHSDAILHLDAKIVHGFIGDRGGHDVAANIDADMRGGRALFHFHDDAPDMVACPEAHFRCSSLAARKEPQGRTCARALTEGLVR